MISTTRTNEIAQGIDDGTIDLNTVSLAEFIQVSFLCLVETNGHEVHLEKKIMYGGQVFNLHTCISEIRPMQDLLGAQRVQ